MTSKTATLTGTTWCNYRTWKQSCSNPDEWYAHDDYDRSGKFPSKLIIKPGNAGEFSVTMSQHNQLSCDMDIEHTSRRFKIQGPFKARKVRNYPGGANWTIETDEDENGLHAHIMWSTEWNENPERGLHGLSVTVWKRGKKREYDSYYNDMRYPKTSTYVHIDLDQPSQRLLLDWFIELVKAGAAAVEDRLGHPARYPLTLENL